MQRLRFTPPVSQQTYMNIGLHSWMQRKMAEVSEEALETRAVGWIAIWHFDSLQRRCRGFDSI